MTLAERLDQFDLAGQMIRVVGLMRCSSSSNSWVTMARARCVSCRGPRGVPRPGPIRNYSAFEPINQEMRRRFVIGGGEAAAVRLIPFGSWNVRFVPLRPMRSTVSIKCSLQRFAVWYSANLMLDEPPLIVVLDALMRRKTFMNQAGPNTRHFVRGDGCSDTASTNGHASFDFSGRHRPSHGDDEIRIIIVRLRLLIAEIDHFVSTLAQQIGQVFL
jgi:hypothetical protein